MNQGHRPRDLLLRPARQLLHGRVHLVREAEPLQELAPLPARLAPRAYEPQETAADRLTSFLARRVIDGIAVIGWLADHLPTPTAPHIGEPTLQRAR